MSLFLGILKSSEQHWSRMYQKFGVFWKFGFEFDSFFPTPSDSVCSLDTPVSRLLISSVLDPNPLHTPKAPMISVEQMSDGRIVLLHSLPLGMFT